MAAAFLCKMDIDVYLWYVGVHKSTNPEIGIRYKPEYMHHYTPAFWY